MLILSQFLSVGPFCGTISSKKKKKMMYLTTRNAGIFEFYIRIEVLYAFKLE